MHWWALGRDRRGNEGGETTTKTLETTLTLFDIKYWAYALTYSLFILASHLFIFGFAIDYWLFKCALFTHLLFSYSVCYLVCFTIISPWLLKFRFREYSMYFSPTDPFPFSPSSLSFSFSLYAPSLLPLFLFFSFCPPPSFLSLFFYPNPDEVSKQTAEYWPRGKERMGDRGGDGEYENSWCPKRKTKREFCGPKG